MFLKTDKVKYGDKVYKYYKIVEAYRDKDGKPKQRLIYYLGALSDDDAKKIRKILSMKDKDELVLANSSDITVRKHWLFLPIVVLHSVWNMFSLNSLFTSPLLVEGMVINRCVNPRSKIQVTDWISQTVLPALCECDVPSDEYAVYPELNNISKQETTIQSHLYKQLEKIDISLGEGIFYDITSTYMEGSHCLIAKYGYSRDHRPDLQQIVIALMVTPQGSPFYWKVLDGNTQDVTTLPPVVNDLKKRFRLKSCHLTFDRGMVSADRLNYLEEQGMTYLTAMDKDEIACNALFDKFLPKPVTIDNYESDLLLYGFTPTDDSKNFYTQEGTVDKRRYIFSFDVIRFVSDQKNWDKRMAQINAWVTEKNKSLMAAKKSRKLEVLESDVKKIIKKRKFKDILQQTITPIELSVTNKNGSVRTVKSFHVSLSINKINEAKAKRLDGITCFITNEPDFTHAFAIQRYREKNKIEEAFRKMKSSLALRPIYLTRVERVKAHVTICVLAYLLMNTIELILKNKGCNASTIEVIDKMMSCQLSEVGFQNLTHCSIVMTQLSSQQKQLIELLDCGNFLEPSSMNRISNFIKDRL